MVCGVCCTSRARWRASVEALPESRRDEAPAEAKGRRPWDGLRPTGSGLPAPPGRSLPVGTGLRLAVPVRRQNNDSTTISGPALDASTYGGMIIGVIGSFPLSSSSMVTICIAGSGFPAGSS